MPDLLPDIFYFNPTCEFAIANGSPNWQPNKLLQKMEDDLSALPQYFGKREDFVLVNQIPSDDFIKSLIQLGFEPSKFIQKSEALANNDFINLPKNMLLPWGWSPAMHKLFSPLKESCSTEFKQSVVADWKPEHRELTSRKFAAEILFQLLPKIKTDFILNENFLPKICTSQNDFEMAIKQWGEIMVKAPWSSSGRGLQPITKTPVHPKVWEKVMGIIKEQGYAIAEPYLKKVFDFSFQFELKKGKIQFLGISNFSTNKNGQYEGNFLNGLPSAIEKQILEFTETSIREIRQPLSETLENSKLSAYYEGVFGVDTLTYICNNQLKINPCLEINLRYTMGLLSLRLENLIYENKKGIYRTYFQPGTSFYVFKNEMEKKHPLRMSNGKIESGFLALTDAQKDTLFGAYILV
jgi:hypothetical protein